MSRSPILLCLLLIMAACTADQYDTGDGRYSYLSADFVRAHTSMAGAVDYAVTDDGDSLILNPEGKASWATKADSVYRALLYYNKVKGGAEPVVITRVPVIIPLATSRPDTLRTDPVTFESAWVSKDGRYLNVGYAVKTGRSDQADTQYQTLGIRLDSAVADTEGRRRISLTMYHDQHGVPEYYSVRGYVSIPLDKVQRPCTLELTVNTYSGVVRREFRCE
ncbi:MAG: NigD-like N-terminal domain-containing protein [Prevotella sp.]|nr:NigD-like N-terminal domain-containing protein [Prevotella sp.]